MNRIALVIGVLLGFLFVFQPYSASAGGYAAGSVQYHSGGTQNYGAPAQVTVYPNGRVVVKHIPVTHVYPAGVSLVHQNGGDRVYSTGYGGAATCYVDCWHGGVSPNSGSGTQWSVGVGVQSNW